MLSDISPISNCFVSALAKSRPASRLVRTMARDSQNRPWLWPKLAFFYLRIVKLTRSFRFHAFFVRLTVLVAEDY